MDGCLQSTLDFFKPYNTGYIRLVSLQHGRLVHETFRHCQKQELIERAMLLNEQHDVFFGVAIRATGEVARNVLPANYVRWPYLVADCDYGLPAFDDKPDWLLETSPNRYQAFWLKNYNEDQYVQECKRIRQQYGTDACHSSFKFMRFPLSYNYKSNYQTRFIK